MRKFVIGFIAVGFVALLFLMYALIMDTQPIEVSSTTEADNRDMPETAVTVQESGNSDVRVAELARYVVLDPETKEISRVFGFKKLLSQETDVSHRQVEKPYMIFYDTDYQCRIDADTGLFQIESSGTSSTPKDARLSGNVKIHVTPKPGSSISETVVEMDDLVFSSERSEFATDRRVHIKSDRVEMEGTGLVVIFDSANGRIDYLRIRDLDRIQIQDLPPPKPAAKPTIAKAEAPTSAAVMPESSAEKVQTDQAGQDEVPQQLRYYQCLLEKNVKIEYGDKIIVSGADHVNIKNILFDRSIEGDDPSERAKDKPKEKQQSNTSSNEKTEITTGAASSLGVIVTCDGGIVLKPMQDEGTEEAPVSQSVLPAGIMPMPLQSAQFISVSQQSPPVEVMNFVGEKNVTVEPNTETLLHPENNAAFDVARDINDSPPVKFEAAQLDYDLLTGSGLAYGPVRFTFYQSPDPNSAAPKSWTPITVTADDNAQFIADSSRTIKQVVFNGNVMATRESSTPDFVQFDKIHSEKLTVDLDKMETDEIDLKRLSVREGRVFVRSERLKNEQLVSKVELSCSEIIYDRMNNEVLAKGPDGQIQLDNSHLSDRITPAENEGVDFNRPCYVYIGGFDQIRWNLNKQKIIADSWNDQLRLAYVPLVDGKPDKYIFINSIRFDLSFMTHSDGKTALKRVFTEKPITYEEWNGDRTTRLHHIVGGRLDYDTTDNGWVIIEETPAVPCKLDGVRMPRVLVHPATGQIETSISTMPGIWKRR